MTNLFANENEQIYLDKIHYNARGNQMIAEELANQMRLMGAQE